MKHITILLLITLTIACNNNNTTSTDNNDWQQGTQPNNTDIPAPKAANNSFSKTIQIYDPTGDLLGMISPGKNALIKTPTLALKGSYTKSDKKKYRSGKGTYAEVKMKDYGFKVRKANGDLLWKVKIMDDGRLKISDNEEGLNAYKLSISDSGDLKLKKDEQEITRSPFDPNDGHLQLIDGQTIKINPNAHPPINWGVFLIPDIEPIHQLIIITELLSR